MKSHPLKKLILASLCCGFLANAFSQKIQVFVQLDSSIRQTVSGRLYLFTEKDTAKGVSGRINPLSPQPTFALNIKNWSGKEPVVIDKQAEGLLFPINQLKPGYYKIAALLDINTEERRFDASPGNLYSPKDVLLQVKETGEGQATVTLSGVFQERLFKENDSIKYLQLQSDLLTHFHKKPTFVKAAVLLPKSYQQQPEKNYPVVYVIPGWEGSHFDVFRGGMVQKRYGTQMGEEKIYVYLNPETQTPFGLHAFVDSRVNGPWGRALVQEVIPYIQQQYRVSKEVSKTFIMGQSSGGYAALWLHFHYPKAFGGSWGVSPDPVDFRNFTGINLYKDQNAYVDSKGVERGFVRQNGQYLTTHRKAMQVEDFIGDGEQQQSFEAEFGKKDKNGRPKMLFDRKSGLINKETVKDWQAYDMTAFLQKNWKRLSPELNGKVHVYAGEVDEYQLNESVKGFQNEAKKRNANIVVELFPGVGHFTIWNEAFTKRVQSEVDALIKSGSGSVNASNKK